MLENLEDIEGLTAEQIEAINQKASGLVSKNSELLNKLSKNKEKAQASLSEVEALRQFKENAEIQAAEDASNWEKVKQLKEESHTKELERISGESAADKELIKTLLVDNGLSAALDQVSINPALKDGAIGLLKGQVSISNGQAMIGEKTLSDAVKEWSETDMGKAYTVATNNSGNGSGGGSHTPASKTFAEMTITERTILANTNPEKYNQLAGN